MKSEQEIRLAKEDKPKIDALKKEMGIWGKERRIIYLMDLREELEMVLIDLQSDYEQSIKKKQPYAERGVIGNYILKIQKRIEKIKNEIYFSMNKCAGKITDEMIASAKEYPIDYLITVKNKKALCLFHDDHHPSLAVFKDNRFKCFSCGESGDVISLAMKIKSINFIEAVKFLLALKK